MSDVTCVVVDYAGVGFVALADDVLAIREEAGATVPVVDLGPALGATEEGRSACVLVVRREGGDAVGFRTTATVRLRSVPARSFVRLPGLLREAGCPPWLRGVAGQASDEDDADALRVWIGLAQLARGVEVPP